MVKTIYVGNLPPAATVDEIRGLFALHGPVHAVKLISDRETGLPRGFGFVEMEDATVEAAISALDGRDFNGSTLRVSEASEWSEPPSRPRW